MSSSTNQVPTVPFSIKSFAREAVWPAVALTMLFVGVERNAAMLILSSAALLAVVLSAVHHAERISERIGEPFGALVLALAVTVIEVSIIVVVMSRTEQAATLARDTIFSAVMIIFTAIVGLALLIGGLRFRTLEFNSSGVVSTLLTLTTISVLTLILPNYSHGMPGPYYAVPQLIFVSVISLLVYLSFLFVQNFKHREDFLDDPDSESSPPPARNLAIRSYILLPVSLVGVVGLAETLAHSLEEYIARVGAPEQLAGLAVAAVVLLPEGIASVRAAANNQIRRSLNLSLGSALASISLTIPAVAFFSIWKSLPLALGIGGEQQVLFLLALMVIVLSLSKGRTHILHGLILLLLFAVFVFLSIF